MMWRVWDKHFNYPFTEPRRYTLRGFYGSPWEPGRIKRAHCNYLSHHYSGKYSCSLMTQFPLSVPLHDPCDIPFYGCTCGIYGMKRDNVPEMVNPMIDVLGIAEIWGNIIVAEYGYRAQYARIRALVNAPEVARDYDVPNLPSVEYARKEYFE